MFRILKDKVLGKKVYDNHKTTGDWKLSKRLKDNISLFKDIFNNDEMIIYREFESDDHKPLRFCIIFTDGMVNNKMINEDIIEPIMQFSADKVTANKKIIDVLMDQVIISNHLKKESNVNEIVSSILYGDTGVLIDGFNEMIVVDTKQIETRSITEPLSETIVRGPREGFTENIMTNLNLLRKRVRSHDLKFEFLEIGERTRTRVCVCYLKDLVNDKILKEVYKRLDDIKIDAILDSHYIQELIEDSALSPFETMGATERPDVVLGKLFEGRIAIVVDGTPFALTLPYVFIESFQVNEDYYNNYLYASFNRIIRFVSFFVASSTAAIYVALTTFHQEMIPTPLILSISASREGVPFPTIVEALFMTLTFDLLRESGVRLPAPIGATIGFVGAIILGESAVTAKFVSAPIVIVAALTGIAGFLTPHMMGPLIFIRLIFLVLSSFLGLYGYIFGLIGLFIHLMSMRSFGIPYMLNVGSLKAQDLKDTAIRGPWWLMYYRPKLIGDKNPIRKKDSELPEKR